jgi:hypothetical protein
MDLTTSSVDRRLANNVRLAEDLLVTAPAPPRGIRPKGFRADGSPFARLIRVPSERDGIREPPMKAFASRIGQVLAVFLAGWSYARWDPPYPGDGV